MNAFERLKHLRKNILKMTQDEFAKKINLSRSNLGSIETGAVSLTERNTLIICETFNVNEDWLLAGTGEIFRKQSLEEEISSYLGELLNDSVDASFQKRFVRALARLDVEEWKVLERFCDMLMEQKKEQE